MTDKKPGKEIKRWSDEAMFRAETSKVNSSGNYTPRARLLDAPTDPLGKLAYIAKAYQGKFPNSYTDISDADRMYYVQDMEKNILGMPSESVMFHFVLENVTRSFTHQLVRTRHACLVGETKVTSDSSSRSGSRLGQHPTLRELYENRKVAGGTKQITIRTVNESGTIEYRKIKDIWEVGVRDVFRLKTHDGREIVATGNHPFQRPDGSFTNLEDLVVGEQVMSNGIELVTEEAWLKDKVDRGAMDRGTYPRMVYPSTIISVEPAGREMVYDLEMDGEYPWFIANGLVVHNSYAQESMRFAVKEDYPVQLPPALIGTVDRNTWWDNEFAEGMIKPFDFREALAYEERFASDRQKMRFKWDEAVSQSSEAYSDLIEMGMPAEDARGLAPHNIVTKLNWVIDLRSLMQVAGQRLCTQAQWEHRLVWDSVISEIRRFGENKRYNTNEPFRWEHESFLADETVRNPAHPGNYSFEEVGDNDGNLVYQRSSAWQYEFLANRFKPVCYQTGRCQFRSDFDRYCSIRDRVEANASVGRPSSEWHLPYSYPDSEKMQDGSGRAELGIPPILPHEWLDPNAAIRPDAEWRSEESLNNIKGRR